MFNEFKKFIARGNVIDMAVGIIIGAAFTSVVNSLVKDIITPLTGVFTGGIDFSSLYINLSPISYGSLREAEAAGVATINYGLFINSVISFLIVSSAVFFLIKAVNHLKDRIEDPKEPDTVPPPKDIQLLSEIRDLLKDGKAAK